MNPSLDMSTIYTGAATLLLLLGAAFPASSQTQVRSDMLVTTAWLQQHLADRDLVVLFVGRTRAAYDAGHIPGARFLPLDELVTQRPHSLNDLPPVAALQVTFEQLGVGDRSRVVLYGEGSGLLAARAYFTLDYLGHGDRVALLDGGFETWSAESRPIEREAQPPVRAEFTPHVRSEVLITTAQMRDIVAGSRATGYTLLDARPPQEFDGSVNSEGVPSAGHLRGANSLYWKTLLQSDNNLSLRDVPQLQTAFAAAGADSDKLIVTYCRTGMQSSFTYFVAKYLGFRAAMYDGSVYEWVNQAGYQLDAGPAQPAAMKAQR